MSPEVARLRHPMMSALRTALGGKSGLDMLTSSSSAHDPGRAITFFLSDKLLATVAVHVDRIVRACFYCCDSVVSPGATSGQCWAIGTVTRRALQHTLLTPGSPPGAV